eukprot:Awhi_evm1s9495
MTNEITVLFPTGGTALVYDSDTFEQKNKIFASSHCWGARVQSTSDGKYVATEL